MHKSLGAEGVAPGVAWQAPPPTQICPFVLDEVTIGFLRQEGLKSHGCLQLLRVLDGVLEALQQSVYHGTKEKRSKREREVVHLLLLLLLQACQCWAFFTKSGTSESALSLL